MLGRVALAVVVMAMFVWRLGFRWEDIGTIITDNLNDFIGASDQPDSQVPRGKDGQSSLPMRLLTVEELGRYNGNEGSKGLYLAVYGQVFDVEKGARHYGPGGGYEFFSGRDATRAYVTGEFNEEGLIDDVEGFTPKQMLEVETWVEFYKKEYTPVGKLIGRFYGANGEPTDAFRKAELVLAEGRREKEKEEKLNRRFPPCNSSWKQKEGTKIWCSEKSGGVVRDWTGLPRRYFVPGSINWNCVCVHDRDLDNPHLKLFDGCGPQDVACYMNNQ